MNDTKILRYETAVWNAKRERLTQVARAGRSANAPRRDVRLRRPRWSRRLATS